MRRRGARWGVIGAVFVVAAAFAVGIEACRGSGGGAETPADILARGGSIARITIGTDAYDFEIACYDAGAGSVVAVGKGTVAGTGGELEETRVLVQAFLGDPYIGVTVVGVEGTGDTVYEADLDETFDLLLEDDVIEAGGIVFVRNLDLSAGVGQPAGEGSLRVTCGGYEKGLPAGLER